MRSSFTTRDWEIPRKKEYSIFVNYLECAILSRKPELLGVLAWTNLCGDIGLLGLRTQDMDSLMEFREVAKEVRVGDLVFTL